MAERRMLMKPHVHVSREPCSCHLAMVNPLTHDDFWDRLPQVAAEIAT